MKTGKIYRRFKATNGEAVTLRALRWEDLDSCVVFVNDLVGEKRTEPNLGGDGGYKTNEGGRSRMADKPADRDREREHHQRSRGRSRTRRGKQFGDPRV